MKTDRKYRADYYFNVPYVIKDAALLQNKTAAAETGDEPTAHTYLEMLDTVFSYECVDSVCSKIARAYIGKFKLSCQSDSSVHKKENAAAEVYAFVSFSLSTGLAFVTLAAPDTHMALEFMTEEFYRGNGVFDTEHGSIPVDAYMRDNYGLARCGNMKNLLCLSAEPEDRMELLYYTAAEEYGTQDVDTMLKPNDMLKLRDISQYESCDIYVNEPEVVAVLHDFSDDYRERAYYEALIQQIIEMMLLKITAVTRMNRRVVDELEKNGSPSISLIEELNTQFAQTIRFWDTDNFVYLSTRNLAAEISAAFKIDAVMQTYDRNQTFLEHLINIRSVQAEEKESKILNFLAIALTGLQCVPIIYQIAAYLLTGSITLEQVFSTFITFGFTGVICLLLIILLKRGKRRNRER